MGLGSAAAAVALAGWHDDDHGQQRRLGTVVAVFVRVVGAEVDRLAGLDLVRLEVDDDGERPACT